MSERPKRAAPAAPPHAGGGAALVDAAAPGPASPADRPERRHADHAVRKRATLPNVAGVRRERSAGVNGLAQLDGRRAARARGQVMDIPGDREANRDLCLTNECLRLLVDSNVVGVVLAESNGRVIEANDYYLDLIGTTRPELERGEVDWRAITPPEWLAVDERAIRELREGGRSRYPYEKEYLRHDGSRVAVIITDALVPGPGERIAGFVLDISDLRRAERALAASEALLRGSLDAMPGAFMICSAVRDDGGAIAGFRIDYLNRMAEAFLGRDPGTMIGDVILEGTIPDMDGSPFVVVARHVVETGITWARRAMASPLHVNHEGAGSYDAEIVRFHDGFFATWRDVTHRERLAGERERLGAIVEQSADAILITSADKRITYANRSFVARTGRDPSEIVGMLARDLLSDLVDPSTIATVDASVSAGRTWSGEIVHEFPGGARRIEVTIAPVRDSDGGISSWIHTLHDVTDLREAEAELALEVSHPRDARRNPPHDPRGSDHRRGRTGPL